MTRRVHRIRHRAALPIRALAMLSVMLLVQGCPSKAPPGVRFPITSGSHHTLPTADQRILVWADPPLDEMAVEWLRTHHYTTILRPPNLTDRERALATARESGAEFVLLLERTEDKEGALIEPHCGTLYNVNVNVRGLSVKQGDLALKGNAHYPQCVDLSDKTFRSLTCQALATAWGMRPSGQLEIPSNLMCTAGETQAIPIR